MQKPGQNCSKMFQKKGQETKGLKLQHSQIWLDLKKKKSITMSCAIMEQTALGDHRFSFTWGV